MKKYIVSFLLVALCLGACSKLEVTPRGEMADKQAAYTNPTIRGQILAGVYSNLMREAVFGRVIPYTLESSTDISISRSGSSTGEMFNNSHTPSSKDLEDLWTYLLSGVNTANEFLYYANMYASDSTVEIAEARFMRAYYYFMLVRLFGDVPFRTAPMLDLNNTDIARTSAVDIYHFIIQEMNDVQGILLEPGVVGAGHVGKTAAQAVLADAYLNLTGYLMKDRLPADSTATLMYERSAYWSRKVIANPAHNITATDYVTVFMNQVQQKVNIKENVWELPFLYQRNVGSNRTDSRIGKYGGMGDDVTIDKKAIYAAGTYVGQTATIRSLFTKVSDEDATKDVRMEWNCPREKLVATKDGQTTKLGAPVYDKRVDYEKYPKNIFQFYIGKWRTIYSTIEAEAADKNYGGAKLSVYRISDIHLMLAEALNFGANDQAEAVNQINIVRRRAGATEIKTVGSQQEVFDLLVDERARELCFEGKRRFDLIRWGRYEEKLMAMRPVYYNTDPDINIAWVQDKWQVFDNFDREKHYILPIPQAEISRNSLIPQSEQNQGWGGSRRWK